MDTRRNPRTRSVLAIFAAGALLLTAGAAWAKKALVLDPTVVGGSNSLEAQRARALGFDVTVVDGPTWAGMSAADFATYELVILGDPNCVGNPSPLAGAEAHPEIWGPAITGNVVALLTDPEFHSSIPGATKLMENGLAFAGAQPGRTGLYVSLSCYYFRAVPRTEVPALSGIGVFTVEGQGGCPNASHIVDTASPVVDGLHDGDLSNWSCSAHGGFDSWPLGFSPVVIIKDIPSSFIAPDGSTGAPYVLARGGGPCEQATLPLPADFSLAGNQWSADFSVSPKDGLVASNLTLASRFMADQISVPYYTIETSAFARQRAELKPAGDDASARSRLVALRTQFGDPMIAEATYAIDRIPAGSASCLIVKQRYEFWAELPDGGCEPSQFVAPIHAPPLPCSRWKPIVEYQFFAGGGETLTSLNIPERLSLRDENKSPNSATIFQDEDSLPNAQGLLEIIKNRQDIRSEGAFTALVGGKAGDWDNYHQSFRRKITGPQSFPIPAPGCPECIHIHWRWGAIIQNPDFGNGKPLIPPGSNQDLQFAVVAFHPGEEHPVDFHDLIDGERLSNQDLVFWYSPTGYRAKDGFFTHGGFFSTLSKFADLAVTMTASPQPVQQQHRITYTITVTNNGPSTATNVALVDTWGLPETTFEPHLSSKHCNPAGGPQVFCTLKNMAAGATITLTVVLHALSLHGAPLVNVARVRGSEVDQEPDNNVAIVNTSVVP